MACTVPLRQDWIDGLSRKADNLDVKNAMRPMLGTLPELGTETNDPEECEGRLRLQSGNGHINNLRSRIEQEIKSCLSTAEEYAQELDNSEGADQEFAKIEAYRQVLEWMDEEEAQDKLTVESP